MEQGVSKAAGGYRWGRLCLLGAGLALIVLLGTPARARAQDAYARGKELLAARQYDAALRHADGMIEGDRLNPAGWEIRGLALYYLGRTGEAFDAFANVRANSDPDSETGRHATLLMAMCRHAQAASRLEAGETLEALALINRALKIQPDYTAGRVLRARIFGRLGDFEKAEAAFARILSDHPGEAQALFDLAQLRIDRSDMDGATEAYERFLETGGGTDAQKAHAHYHVSGARMDRMDFAGAAVALREAVRLNPELEVARQQLKRVEEMIGKIQKATAAEKHLLLLALAVTAVYAALLLFGHRKIRGLPAAAEGEPPEREGPDQAPEEKGVGD
jgi:tetratricopeptide (TPR) repeat protein